MVVMKIWRLLLILTISYCHPRAMRDVGMDSPTSKLLYRASDRRDARYLYNTLQLHSHFEGGRFRETWRGDRQVTFTQPTAHGSSRTTGTSIYYLLEDDEILVWHKLLSDVVYVWHTGGTLKLHLLDVDGTYSTHLIGDLLKNRYAEYQVIVPHDVWYAGEIIGRTRFVLFGEVVCPGFEFVDYTEGTYAVLTALFPQHEQIIKRFTTS